MELSDLGAIGEFVSSIAVFVTLVFLTIETRNNSKLLARSNARQTSSDHRQALGEILDKEVSELFLRGNSRGLESLTPEERYRFDLAYCIWLQSIEQAYADYRDGLYPADHLVAYENTIPAFLKTPGGSQWWEERRIWFGHAFRAEVERLLEAPPEDALESGLRSA